MTPGPAWQAALAAEHRAVAGYSSLGPRLAAALQTLARRCQAEHRGLRDATAVALRARGVEPVTALADYPLPFPLPTAAAAARLALTLETACAAAWRELVLAASGDAAAHAAGQDGLTASAVRATRWRVHVRPGAPSVPFPGT